MNPRNVLTLVVCLASASLAQNTASLHGVITDPSGASAPDAMVQVRGSGLERRARTDGSGQYTVATLPAGHYTVRVIAKGFTLNEKPDVVIGGATTLDVQLSVQLEAQVINVEDEANKVGTDPAQNGGVLVLGPKELAVLSDDPDELSQELQAMAGPSGGPSGGQIYIDGFTGGNLPPKSSIREVRINSNPFSPEYDRPGFGRIEIFTKPGTDNIRGQAFFQFNDQYLNSRSPLLTQSDRPPYRQKFYGLNLSGPIKKSKASFGFDFERRNIDENAFVIATTLDSSFNRQTVNSSIVTPQTRTTFTPRVDYAINDKNSLTLRYQSTRSELDKEGVGSFNLASQAYNQKLGENTVQATETAILSPHMINESRFQFLRTSTNEISGDSTLALIVQGAFSSGGAQIGNSGSTINRWEFTNTSTLTQGTHTFKAGARVRQSFLNDKSVNNFNGTYTFFGADGPALDANNQVEAGNIVALSAFERYRRTLLFQRLGYSAARIRLLGGGASQFSIGAGTPLASVTQFDAGLFANDDWRILPNLTLSYGLRYEVQTNIKDHGDYSPRIGIAWGVDSKGGKPGKTVLRFGFGTFYDRIADSTTLQAERYNGVTQQSYLLMNPDTYPFIPSVATLSANKQTQQLQLLYATLKAPRTYQWSAGVDRQVNKYIRLSANYIGSRGVDLQRSVNVNAPVNGVYPYGDRQLRLLTESVGLSRTQMLIISPNVNYKKIFLFGFYGLSYGKSDAEGQPADPNNLHAEWGPSSFGDVRNRFLLGTSVPMPWKFSLSPFMFVSSGTPYNITTGRDTNGDGVTSERPALLSGVGAEACTGADLKYEAGFGCFNLNPAPGVAAIGRNFARGPMNSSINLRLARTWAFGSRGESGPANQNGPPPGMGGGPPGGGPGGAPPPGMFGATSGKKYNLTLSVSARNILNHASYAAPSGDLSSPFFGQYRSLAGFGPFGANSTYNRKVEMQLRFQF